MCRARPDTLCETPIHRRCFCSFQENISEPDTFSSRDVKLSLEECVDCLRRLHEGANMQSLSRLERQDGHVFHVFDTAE
jgi:hypothetical protein